MCDYKQYVTVHRVLQQRELGFFQTPTPNKSGAGDEETDSAVLVALVPMLRSGRATELIFLSFFVNFLLFWSEHSKIPDCNIIFRAVIKTFDRFRK